MLKKKMGEWLDNQISEDKVPAQNAEEDQHTLCKPESKNVLSICRPWTRVCVGSKVPKCECTAERTSSVCISNTHSICVKKIMMDQHVLYIAEYVCMQHVLQLLHSLIV
jgi:hypothetical protein